MSFGKLPAKKREGKKRRDYSVTQQSMLWYGAGRIFFAGFFRLWVRKYRAHGMEHVPREGGAFLVANHTSSFDPVVIAYPVKHRVMGGPGKIELFSNPVGAYIIGKIGLFPLRQGMMDATAVRTMVAMYRAGKLVVVYPEGGRSETSELQPFFPDFARLVIRLKAPIVPIGMVGVGNLLPIGAIFPRPNTAVVVRFGEMFELNQFYDREITREVAAEAAEIMRQRVAQLMAEAEAERVTL